MSPVALSSHAAEELIIFLMSSTAFELLACCLEAVILSQCIQIHHLYVHRRCGYCVDHHVLAIVLIRHFSPGAGHPCPRNLGTMREASATERDIHSRVTHHNKPTITAPSDHEFVSLISLFILLKKPPIKSQALTTNSQEKLYKTIVRFFICQSLI